MIILILILWLLIACALFLILSDTCDSNFLNAIKVLKSFIVVPFVTAAVMGALIIFLSILLSAIFTTPLKWLKNTEQT